MNQNQFSQAEFAECAKKAIIRIEDAMKTIGGKPRLFEAAVQIGMAKEAIYDMAHYAGIALPIPIMVAPPKTLRGAPIKYPWASLAAKGDAFTVACSPDRKKALQASLTANANKRHGPGMCSVVSVPSGVRVIMRKEPTAKVEG